MASFLNGLSAMGAGVSAFAGAAGLEQQRASLAQQQAVLADQLATTRETALEGQRQTFQTGLEGQRQTFQAGQSDKEIAARGAQSDRESAARASEGKATRDAELQRTQMTLDAPSADIKSAKQFATLSPDEKRAYREEMMTKAGLPSWMIGGGDTPSPPAGGGAVYDAPTVTPDAPVSGSPVSSASPSAADLSRNQKALEGVPGPAASIVKGMVDGRISPPSSFAMSKPYWQGLIAKAAEYDPTFDQTTWSGRVATKKDFASGQSARAVTAMNTALSHAGTLAEDFDALNNSGSPWVNWAVNGVEKSAFGDARQTKTKQTVDALASEARKVFAASGGGNLTELLEWQKNFDVNGSPAQQKASLTGFVELLDGRLQSLADQYNRGMGRTDDPLNLLQPKARAVYEKLTGREPANATGYQMGKPPASGDAAASSAASPAPAAAAIPSWVKPGDQYSPSRGQARGADGTTYGAPQ